MTSVLVPLAAGCGELEAVTIIDLLRRAHIDVYSAGLIPGQVTCGRGTFMRSEAAARLTVSGLLTWRPNRRQVAVRPSVGQRP